MIPVLHYARLIIIGVAVGTFAAGTGTSISPDRAMTLLMEGNERYVSNKAQHLRQDQERRTITSVQGQHPFVSILSCSDSRVAPEILFDAGIGDLFVTRVAGNVVDNDEVGTLEYGIEHLGTPLLLVLGHTKCGAVSAAVENTKVGGSLPFIIEKIKPAVKKAIKNNPTLSGDSLVNAAIIFNIWLSIEDIFKRSKEIQAKVKMGNVKVIGGIYDIESGTVTFLGPHAHQEKFLEIGEEKTEAKEKRGPRNPAR